VLRWLGPAREHLGKEVNVRKQHFVGRGRNATRLTLDPTRGGAIREFTWRGQDFLHPAPAAAGDDSFEYLFFNGAVRPLPAIVGRVGAS
jgi:hypothetical protein